MAMEKLQIITLKIVLADGTMILAADLLSSRDADNNYVEFVNIIVDINGFKNLISMDVMSLRSQFSRT